MAVSDMFFTTTTTAAPSDGYLGAQSEAAQADTKRVSDFVTVQSFANFAIMSTAITGAWRALEAAASFFEHLWTPLGLCLLFGLVSVFASKPKGYEWASALFIALINSLVLFGAVVGVDHAVSNTPVASPNG